MKIKYLRSHNGNAVDSTEVTTKDRGNYLVRVGAAKEVKEAKKPTKRKTKELKTDKKTK